MAKINATIFTGFLGAGKTSLIRDLANQAQKKKFAFLINEFGDLGIDGGLLSGCGQDDCDENSISDDDIIELANGCICCTVADDFLPAMEKILAREQKIDHIIIETSGLALPKPLVKAFNWPSIKPYVTVDGVISVVDAAAINDGLLTNERAKIEQMRLADESIDHETPIEELFEEQLQCADLVILSKTDMIDIDALTHVKQQIKPYLRAGVQLMVKPTDKLPLDALLGIGAGAENDLEARPSHHDDVGEAHDHDDFTSLSITFGEVESPEKLRNILQEIIVNHQILRIKGFIAYQNISKRGVVQAVGQRINLYFDDDFAENAPKTSNLVFIGTHDIDEAQIREDFLTKIPLQRN